MEVCFKCHLPIKETDEFIVGDPDGKKRGWWRYGDWDYSNMHMKPIEKNKYHVNCFNEEKDYFNKLFKKRLVISLTIAIGMLILFGVIAAIVIGIVL